MSAVYVVTGFQRQNGHTTAWVRMPNGVSAAFQFCPGEHPALDAALEVFESALAGAVELTVAECQPEIPSVPPEIVMPLPCRICDVASAANVERNGFSYCPSHAPAAE